MGADLDLDVRRGGVAGGRGEGEVGEGGRCRVAVVLKGVADSLDAGIGAGAAIEIVGPRPAVEAVVVRIAVKLIRAAAAGQGVVAAAAVKLIVVRAAGEGVVPARACLRVAAAAAGEGVRTGVAGQGVAKA